MNLFKSLWSWLIDGYWPHHDVYEDRPLVIRGPQRRYTLQRLLAVGDVADVFLGSAAGEASYLLKVSRVPEGRALLDREHRTLTKLRSAARGTSYRHYLPTLVESFPATDRFPKWVNVFRYESGFHTLEQVHEQHPALDGRHLAWIFKRLLTILGFCHRQGTLHGALLPSHVLLDPASHGLRLVGWGQSVATGARIETAATRYLDWYPSEVRNQQPAAPATDLFLAARCMIYLAGGDPVRNRMPDAVPLPMQRFFESCLLEAARMRPDDAWVLLEHFDEQLRRLYGPPKFYELTLI